MNELNKNDSKMLQGLSVLAMLCLHLFCRFDSADLYRPIIFLGGVPLTFYIGQISDFCVFGFAFCSGYGHMVSYCSENWNQKRWKRLFSVLCSYWIVLIVFSGISMIMGYGSFMPGSLFKFVASALTIESYYNGAWWYMFAYVVIVLISPLLLKCVQKYQPMVVLIGCAVLYCMAYYVRFNVSTTNWALLKFGPLGMTIAEYMIGAECYQHRVLSRIYEFWKNPKKFFRLIFAGLLIVTMLYVRTKVIQSLFVAPVTGFILMVLFHFWDKPKTVQKVFLFLGKHSTNIWLTHMFFYLVLFEGLVFRAKYPLLILLYMLTITCMVSILLQTLEKSIKSVVIKKDWEDLF